jgi:5,10-methylenetetrahydromethanopterin reductase
VATATRHARVATAVINPFTRGAVLLAVTAATLDELCAGRFVLGLGAGSPTVLMRQGLAFDRPLTRLRETVTVVRRLLSGEEVSFAGETIQVSRARLDFTPVRSDIPIYLGVTGPSALALAGEIADGVILNGFVSHDYTRRAVETVRASVRAAGRDPGRIEIAGSMVVSVAATTRAALDAARPLVALYLAEFPNVARESGISPDLIQRIATVRREQGLAAAAELVADAVVADLTCAGTIEEVQAALARRRRAGVALPILSPVQAQTTTISWLGQLAT